MLPKTPYPDRSSARSPLAIPAFRLLWIAQTISVFGDQFFVIALPWLASDLTGSAVAVGTVLMISAIPRAALMLVGGALTDRLPPTRILIASNLARGALVALISALVMWRWLEPWQLYALALAFGAVDAFFYPAFTALVPTLLGADRLAAGNSLLQGAAQVSSFVGPAVAGTVVAKWGVAPAFAFDAVTFLVAAAILVFLTRRRDAAGARHRTQPSLMPDHTRGSTEHLALAEDIRQGLQYAWRYPATVPLLLLIAVLSFSFAGPLTVGLVTVTRRQSGGAATLGTLLSASGGGALAGTLLAGWVGRLRRRGIVWLAMTGAAGIGLALLGFVSNIVAASLLIAALSGGSGFVNVGFLAWLQENVPTAMLGRIMSLVMFASVGLTPLSYVLAGMLAAVSPRLMFAAAGFLAVAVVSVAAANRTLREID